MFGVKAVVNKHQGSLLQLEVPVYGKAGEPLPSRRYDCDISDVVLVTGKETPALEKKNLSRLTGGEKRFMIKQCWGNDMPDHLAPGGMLSDAHLRAAYEGLQWQYQAQEVRMASATVAKIVASEGPTTPEGVMAIAQLKEELQLSLHYIVPVHCSAPLHWTFLSIRTKEQGTEEILGVDYIDWLHGVSGNRVRAEMIWQCLSEGKMGALPRHCNGYRQRSGSMDCGLAGAHVLENVIKELRGEGVNAMYPDAKELRKSMEALLRVLGKEHDNWVHEVATDKKPTVIIDLPGTVITDKKDYREKLKTMVKNNTLIHKKEHWYGCHTCRWTSSGLGCCYCNPAKHEAILKHKLQETGKLKHAMEAALKAAIATGLIPPMEKAPLPPPAESLPAMDQAPPSPPGGTPSHRVSGGGGIFSSSEKIYYTCRIYYIRLYLIILDYIVI